MRNQGPLAGIKVIELAGLGPAPFAAMVLADMGADVLRVDRADLVTPDAAERTSWDLLNRGRRSVGVNLKHPDGVATVLSLVERADVLIEGFRPGVMERLGLGPDVCSARNAKLVYARMTGFGQSGPLAQAAGHDINYIALSGALDLIGRAGQAPTPPLNLLGDFGGGAMFLVAGVLAALLERASSGRGQVVDAAMIDGSALLCTMLVAFRRLGQMKAPRGENVLDTGAPFYDVYRTKDGKFVAVGAIEPQFFAELVKRLGFEGDARFAAQMDPASWPAMRAALAARFAEKTRDDWAELQGGGSCFTPVLSLEEAPTHPHNSARNVFVEHAGGPVPGPAPRFSRTPASVGNVPAEPGAHTDEALAAWGLPADAIDKLRREGAIR